VRRQPISHIINVSSIGGRVGVPHLAPYCAGKFALAGLSEVLRAELAGDGVWVTLATPGLMRTGSVGYVRVRGDHVAEARWFAALGHASRHNMRRRRDRARSGGDAGVAGAPAACREYARAGAHGGVLQAVSRRVLPNAPGPSPSRASDLDLGWAALSAGHPAQPARAVGVPGHVLAPPARCSPWGVMNAQIADSLAPTGVEGLDNILGGGLPAGCFYLVQGDPGSGKTTLALQFLFAGLSRGESVFYITLSETRAELERVARSHGWTLDKVPLLELSAIEALLTPDAQTTVFHPSELELNSVAQLVIDEARKIQPARVVFDSLSEFRLMGDTQLRYRRQLLSLKQAFAALDSTVLLLDDRWTLGRRPAHPQPDPRRHRDGQLRPLAGARRIRVQKMRVVPRGITIAIMGGIRTFPRLVPAEHHVAFTREAVSSGVPALDALLGGGLDRGTTTLILGQAGTGKSTMALQYAATLAAQGEPSQLFAFDETRGIVLARADALGLRLSEHVESGLITLQQVDPAELSPGEFACRIAGRRRRPAVVTTR
jgi:KaiC/GvpD/RAD55 family RecA-like ATPase